MGIFGSGKKRSRDAAAVITGAGSGIGEAFAIELARRGGRVVCSDIDENAARATADAIVASGGEALAARCDVSRLDDVAQLAKVAQDWFGGPPTVVINNAGVGGGGSAIGETDIDDWNWLLGINLWGPIHGCHVFAPILREAGYGGIINVASAAAFGAHGVLVPERRTASMSASAWKTSAGAAARIPVARATNLNRALKSYKDAGLMVVGLDMGGEVELPELDAATEPLVLVVGSEGKGLARLVRENCDIIVSIPMTSSTESLNAGIATGVALYEISRRRGD